MQSRFFYSKFYTPEEYSLDFLKEKIKSFCYYMWSKKKKRIIKYIKFDIYLEDEEESVEEIVTCCIYSDINNNLYEIGEDFNNLKTHFFIKHLLNLSKL